jgi:hypothetical protein
MGRTPREPLKAPAPAPDSLPAELVADVARCQGYVGHTRTVAERAAAGELVVAELADVEERLSALHLVALVAGGWCARCGAQLTDPGQSPSGARHCRACRLGWTLAEEAGRARAVARQTVRLPPTSQPHQKPVAITRSQSRRRRRGPLGRARTRP